MRVAAAGEHRAKCLLFPQGAIVKNRPDLLSSFLEELEANKAVKKFVIILSDQKFSLSHLCFDLAFKQKGSEQTYESFESMILQLYQNGWSRDKPHSSGYSAQELIEEFFPLMTRVKAYLEQTGSDNEMFPKEETPAVSKFQGS